MLLKLLVVGVGSLLVHDDLDTALGEYEVLVTLLPILHDRLVLRKCLVLHHARQQAHPLVIQILRQEALLDQGNDLTQLLRRLRVTVVLRKVDLSVFLPRL